MEVGLGRVERMCSFSRSGGNPGDHPAWGFSWCLQGCHRGDPELGLGSGV